MIDREEFLSSVANRANIPKEDSVALVDAFFAALAKKVDRVTWDTIEQIVPLQVGFVSPSDDDDHELESVEEFVLELANQESVADERAADHARAVATAIRVRATDSQLAEIQTAVTDEAILALFETTPGELTTSPSG